MDYNDTIDFLNKVYDEKEKQLLHLLDFWTEGGDAVCNDYIHLMNMYSDNHEHIKTTYKYFSDILLPDEGYLITSISNFKQTHLIGFAEVFQKRFNVSVSEKTIFITAYKKETDTHHVLLINDGNIIVLK